MDEYISRNELLKAVQSNVAEAHNERCAQLLEAILNAPTADVAPKSEVARKICCEIEEEIVAALESNYKARTRYYTKQKYEKVDEEFINTVNGKIAALRGIEGFIAELKKKYTEENEK